MASRRQRSSKSRKTVMFGPDVGEPASSGSSKKQFSLQVVRHLDHGISCRNKSRMSISGGEAFARAFNFGYSQSRTKTSMGASVAAKVSMGGAVHKSSHRLMHTS